MSDLMYGFLTCAHHHESWPRKALWSHLRRVGVAERRRVLGIMHRARRVAADQAWWWGDPAHVLADPQLGLRVDEVVAARAICDALAEVAVALCCAPCVRPVQVGWRVSTNALAKTSKLRLNGPSGLLEIVVGDVEVASMTATASMRSIVGGSAMRAPQASRVAACDLLDDLCNWMDEYELMLCDQVRAPSSPKANPPATPPTRQLSLLAGAALGGLA